MSNVKPPSRSSRPAACASARPLSDRSTSVQPVNRFSRFQMLSPWRSRTSARRETTFRRSELADGRPNSGISGARRSEALLRSGRSLVVLWPCDLERLAEPGLDLPGCRRSDRQVGDGRVFGLCPSDAEIMLCITGAPRAMFDRVERLGDRADLVELDEELIAEPIGDAALENLRIGHEDIVAHELHAVAQLRRQPLPPAGQSLPSARPSFDRDDQILPGPVLVEGDQVIGRSARLRPTFSRRSGGRDRPRTHSRPRRGRRTDRRRAGSPPS